MNLNVTMKMDSGAWVTIRAGSLKELEQCIRAVEEVRDAETSN